MAKKDNKEDKMDKIEVKKEHKENLDIRQNLFKLRTTELKILQNEFNMYLKKIFKDYELDEDKNYNYNNGFIVEKKEED